MYQQLQKLNDHQEAKEIFKLLNSEEEQVVCLFVGGCVRDILYGKEVSDIDFATSLNPETVKNKLKSANISYNDSFEHYGSIKVFINEKTFEINSLRKDFDNDGRHSNIIFTQDWKQDALRRDFTINAIYSDLDGRVYDPFKGVEDLNNGILRFIGDPEKRIKEDYLRALRYFRFFIQFSKVDYDDYIINCIKNNQDHIEKLSNTRLIEELKKILLSGESHKLFENYFVKDLYLSVYKGIKYLTRLEFKRKKKVLNKDIDWIIILSLLLIDQTKNYERFVKDFNLSNEIKNRFSKLQSQFTFKTPDTIEKIDNLKKGVLKFGVSAVIDFIHFQYLINDKYDYDLYQKNLKIIKEINPPSFEFNTEILIKKGFKEDKNLGNALKFLEQRWLANNYEIREKDINDAIELFK
jgi:tRNA nucleotidyltransferase/poly(A) polymerase